jgi:hypothetical protein
MGFAGWNGAQSSSAFFAAPYQVPRGPTLLVSVLIVAAITASVGGAAYLFAPGTSRMEVAKQRPAESDSPPTSDQVDDAIRAGHLAAWGFLTSTILLYGGMLLAYMVGVVLMIVWVAQDVRDRGIDNPTIWVLILFLSFVIGLLVYMMSRPPGPLVPCAACSRRRLMTTKVCPHCGNP